MRQVTNKRGRNSNPTSTLTKLRGVFRESLQKFLGIAYAYVAKALTLTYRYLKMLDLIHAGWAEGDCWDRKMQSYDFRVPSMRCTSLILWSCLCVFPISALKYLNLQWKINIKHKPRWLLLSTPVELHLRPSSQTDTGRWMISSFNPNLRRNVENRGTSEKLGILAFEKHLCRVDCDLALIACLTDFECGMPSKPRLFPTSTFW